jgi:hypothetical protein
MVAERKTYHGGTETRRNGKELKARVLQRKHRKVQIKCQAFKNSVKTTGMA